MIRLLRSRWLAGAALALVVPVIVWVFLQAREARNQADPASARRLGQPIPVRTALVEQNAVEEVIGATAVTIPSELAVIRIGPSRGLSSNSPVSDVVVKAVHVHQGDRVSPGQLLLELEDAVFRQTVKQREAALASAQAALQTVKQQTSLNQQVRELTLKEAMAEIAFRSEDVNTRKEAYDIFTRLFKGKASTITDYWDALSKYNQARFQLGVANVNLQKAKDQLQVGQLTDQKDLAKAQNDWEIARIDLEMARRDLERTQIKNPLDGFVDKVDIVPGSIVGVNTDLTHVLRLDPIHLRLDFPQERMDEIATGQKADVILDSFPGETFTGRVIRIPPQVDSRLRVLPVLVELNNSNHRIKAGISGYVRLRVHRTATTLPSQAVLQQQSRAVVFRVEEGRARLREVRLGTVVGKGLHEVRGGLVPGDEIVLYPSNFYKNQGILSRRGAYLKDNDPVDTDWRRWARRG